MTDLLVIDLDGTLITTNSFTRFVVYFLSDQIRNLRLGLALHIIGVVISRKLRVISHAMAKECIMKSCRNVYGDNQTYYSKFSDRLMRYLRPSVIELKDKYIQRGAKAVLATAAPAEYAEAFAQKCGFDFCIASGCQTHNPSTIYECKGTEKLRRVVELCRRDGLKLSAVVTDHSDDLPLMHASPDCYLVSPSLSTVEIIRQQGINYTLVE